MLLPTESLDLMKHATNTHFMHGSHGPFPLLKICCLTCHLCHLLSSDPDDQSRLDMEVLKFWKQAYATSTKTTYKSQLRAYLTFCVHYGYQPLPASTITMQLSWHTLCLLPRFQLTLTLSVFSIWNMAWKTLDCSQSPIFPLDRRCQSLSLTGRHLGLLMRAKLGRVQNARG